MKLSTCLHQFFDQYLPRIKGASDETINSYRQCFTLFLKFAAACQNQAVKDIQAASGDVVSLLVFDTSPAQCQLKSYPFRYIDLHLEQHKGQTLIIIISV